MDGDPSNDLIMFVIRGEGCEWGVQVTFTDKQDLGLTKRSVVGGGLAKVHLAGERTKVNKVRYVRGAPGIATGNKNATNGAPGLTTRSKKLLGTRSHI